ncbi:MAG: DUF2782 domain-containing protein [Betaproteobacteria bacterium]|nr:DUF2782 domain-containing protein [Betaproteobacteria bacterium]
MRRLLVTLLLGAAATAFAQQPPKLEPLPEPPAPPGIRDIGADEPRIRIAPADGDHVEEVRENGRVIMLKVAPSRGVPYFLVDNTGSGNWMRRESLDDGVRVPMWTIRTFD